MPQQESEQQDVPEENFSENAAAEASVADVPEKENAAADVPADPLAALFVLAAREPAAGMPAPDSEDEIAEILRRKRRNGLSLADAARAVLAAGPDISAPEPVWENPEADTEKSRMRKFAAAESLGAAFPPASEALKGAAGRISAAKWSARWQNVAESAARNFIDAAGTLVGAAADFSAATGLFPPDGSLGALERLAKLVGALVAVRGEDPRLMFGDAAGKNLEELRAATQLAESLGRHRELLSLAYPESASGDERLEAWLKLWNDAEISRAFARWRKRRQVVRSLRELAGGAKETPLDPRVDLGNLIALRESRKEFSEKYSVVAAAFPSFFDGSGLRDARKRLDALEKTRAGTAAALARLENLPEKRDAWASVFARWLGGNEAAFAAGGEIEKALVALKAALEGFAARRAEFVAAAGTELSPEETESPAAAAAFVRRLLEARGSWRAVCEWNAAALGAERRGMASFAEAVRAGTLAPERAKTVFEARYCRRWAEAVLASEPETARRFAAAAREGGVPEN